MLWEGIIPQPPTLGAWCHSPLHRFWLGITSFLPNNSQAQAVSWHKLGTAPSRQFGCGHPALEGNSAATWTWAVPLPAVKQPQAHRIQQYRHSFSLAVLRPVKPIDPTMLLKRCIPRSNAYFTHCLVWKLWFIIFPVMCRFCIGVVFFQNLITQPVKMPGDRVHHLKGTGFSNMLSSNINIKVSFNANRLTC